MVQTDVRMDSPRHFCKRIHNGGMCGNTPPGYYTYPAIPKQAEASRALEHEVGTLTAEEARLLGEVNLLKINLHFNLSKAESKPDAQQSLPGPPTALQTPPTAMPLSQVKPKAGANNVPPSQGVKANARANNEQSHPLKALLASHGVDLSWSDILPHYRTISEATRNERKRRLKVQFATGDYGEPLVQLCKQHGIPLPAKEK
jgi:hypothetical protein